MSDKKPPKKIYDLPFDSAQYDHVARSPKPWKINGKIYDFTKVPLDKDHKRLSTLPRKDGK